MKAFDVRRQPLTGDGTESGKSNHFSKSCSTRLRVCAVAAELAIAR